VGQPGQVQRLQRRLNLLTSTPEPERRERRTGRRSASSTAATRMLEGCPPTAPAPPGALSPPSPQPPRPPTTTTTTTHYVLVTRLFHTSRQICPVRSRHSVATTVQASLTVRTTTTPAQRLLTAPCYGAPTSAPASVVASSTALLLSLPLPHTRGQAYSCSLLLGKRVSLS
jgi:hypothetical protein